MKALRTERVARRSDLRAFRDLPYDLHANDPQWVKPG